MVWITQWLCARRHCSIAIAWDDTVENQAKIEAQGENLFKEQHLNRHCHICGPGNILTIESGKTRFKTINEAQPHLMMVSLENLITRAIIGDSIKKSNLN